MVFLTLYVIVSLVIFIWSTLLYFDYYQEFIASRNLWLRGGVGVDPTDRYRLVPAKSDKYYMKMVTARKNARREALFSISGLFMVWPVALLVWMLNTLTGELSENNNFEDVKTNE